MVSGRCVASPWPLRGLCGSFSIDLALALRHAPMHPEVAVGTLRPGRKSRIEFPEPVALQAGTTSCLYLATNHAAGIAFGEELC